MSETALNEVLLSKIKTFVTSDLEPLAQELDEADRAPKELLEKMKQMGFFGIPYSREYGGQECSYANAMSLITEVSKASAGVGLLYTVHWMAVDTLIKFGSPSQKERYLSDLVSGKKIAAYSISESIAGSDASGIHMRAVKEDTGWLLNGSKYFVTNGGLADVFVVLAKEEALEAGGRDTFRLFIVNKDQEGISITKSIEKMGCRSSSTTNLTLKALHLKEEQEIKGGLKAALYGLVGGRMGMAAIGIGLSESALKSSLEYSKKRMAYGKPISKMYAIQEKVAEMHIAIESSKALIQNACLKRDQGEDYSLEASVAKVSSAKTANDVCFEALQILGGHGYTKDYPLERLARDARLMDIGVGTSEVMKMLIGINVINQ